MLDSFSLFWLCLNTAKTPPKVLEKPHNGGEYCTRSCSKCVFSSSARYNAANEKLVQKK